MTGVLRSILPGSSAKVEDHEDDYSVEYSFAMEYSGPPISHDIPQVVPVDVHRIPTAAMAARNVILSNLSLPVIQPIVKRNLDSKKSLSKELKPVHSRVYSRKMESYSNEQGGLDTIRGDSGNVLDEAVSSGSSDTLGFSDVQNDLNQLSGSSDVEDLNDACKATISYPNHLSPSNSESNESTSRSHEISSEISSREDEEDLIGGSPSSPQGNRVTFHNLPPDDASSKESDQDEHEIYPVVVLDLKKGLCYRCEKRSRFSEREICVVCGAKYCGKCVLRAMGSMPEGRKCITCIGYRIDESKRGLLGKCTGMLRRLLGNEVVKQIMSAEISCRVNQLPPQLIFVNDKALSIEELVLLQSCANPPRKLRPGKYWYDKVSGFWGNEGEKPSQIISAELQVGYSIRQDASNGNTNVVINNREITKAELWMLQAAGIHCEGSPHFWVTSDGSYQHEGMKNVMGKLWDKKRVKLVCAALSLPYPSDTSNLQGVGKDTINPKSIEQKMMNKILLVGCDQSGTSTIFKQAKLLYDVPFSEDEKENIKFMIQRNLYSYIAILLEGHERFAEDHEAEINRLRDEPGPSGSSDIVEEKNTYTFSPRLKAFSTWLLQVMMSGNLEAIFPAATREYSPLLEELWKDKSFQATYNRRNELPMLPKAAHYFLERAVEISRMDYEPSQMDILHAEGITSSNGVAAMEFSFPMSSREEYMETFDQNDPSTSYQLIRVHTSSLGENCKWLEMFEDVDLVIYCVSLTEYDEYHEDITGKRTNKMLATKKHFETIVTHQTLRDKDFLLLLTKYDLLEEKIEQVPLTECEWFQEFSPLISQHQHNSSSNNPPLAQRAFHFVAVKFKRLFETLSGRKLFVSWVTGLEGDSVDKALRYGKEVLKWEEERQVFSTNEYSTGSVERSTTA